ncbi:MAG: class I SAM-dependent methyltransferase, partial [Proteobacteria bacterium]|nr:class I SAM-dependent methyltransferase [Pseudomonadota bacterium]
MDEYARIAPLYDTVVGPFLRPVHAALVEALRAVAGDGPVVDLCCGTGVVAGMVARTGREAIGVDLSPAMLDRARARHGGA